MAIRRNKKKSEDTLVDLVEARDSAQDFVEENQNSLLIVMTAMVLLVGGYFAYKYLIKIPKDKEASQIISKAQDYFERDSFALALQSGDGSYQGMLEIIENYGSTKAGNLANYYAGISYLKLGQFDAAISYLDDFDDEGRVLPITKYGAMGDAYGELNQFDEAISNYRYAIAEEDNEFLQSHYLKKLGLLYERQGNFSGASEAFARIKKEFPLSPDGRDIEKYLSRVQAKL
ncbi:MAG: tetratricopeptide repeat protein [Saprospiraceae bacterium]|nr:tetratricopeptide repeat protein [Saprospiraceae bacterium]